MSPEWYAEQYAIWRPHVPPPRTISAFPDNDGPIVYDTWYTYELLDPEEMEFDVEDDVFRDTLVDLSFFRGPPLPGETEAEEEEAFDRFWNEQPDWQGSTTINIRHLRSQAIATFVVMTPRRHHGGLVGTATRESCCWDEWAEAGRYLLGKLDDLGKQKSEQSAQSLQADLMQGWQTHVEEKGLGQPQFHAGISEDITWGTSGDNVERLFTRVVLFAQAIAKSQSASAPARTDGGEAVTYSQGDESLRPAGYLKQEKPAPNIRAPNSDVPDPVQAIINTTTALNLGHHAVQAKVLSEDAKVLLKAVVAELKKHTVVWALPFYTTMAQALIPYDIGCTSGEELSRKQWPGSFSKIVGRRSTR